jgi:altronate hydrolase
MSMQVLEMNDEPSARALRLDRRDNVLVAVTPVPASSRVEGVLAVQDIPAGHKLASVAIAQGEPVR